jgi:hypothetical protein
MPEKLNRYTGIGLFVILAALIVGVAGCGTPSQTVQIRTWSDLNGVRNNLGAVCVLANDLDSTTAGYDQLASPTANEGKGWQPIGTRAASFYGSFDGQGHEIRDLFIDRPTEIDVGLFGAVYNLTTTAISNLGVANARITGQEYVGVLAGISYGSLNSCYSSGNVTGEEYVGVLMGGNAGTVSASYSAGSAVADTLVGGLLGGNTGTVTDSYSLASAIGDSRVGGLIGGNGGTASNCYTTGTVGGNDDVGGLVGADFDGTVTNSFWDTQTSGRATSASGTGKMTAEMQNIATFSGAGWNIIGVASPTTRSTSYTWNIVNGSTYPFLSSQPS